jgi:hypothetical protein
MPALNSDLPLTPVRISPTSSTSICITLSSVSDQAETAVDIEQTSATTRFSPTLIEISRPTDHNSARPLPSLPANALTVALEPEQPMTRPISRLPGA